MLSLLIVNLYFQTQSATAIRDIVYAIKEVNAASGKSIFNVILLINPPFFSDAQANLKAQFSESILEYQKRYSNCVLVSVVFQ